MVIDTRVKHTLADGQYAKRRADCDEAARSGWGSWSPRSRAAAVAGAGGLSAAAFVVASLVGLPAVGGSVPVEARLGSHSTTSGGPGAVVFAVVDSERQRRAGMP